MKTSLLLALAFISIAPLSARADAAPPGGARAAFGNTVLIIDPDGRSRKIWLQPDGSWTGLSRRGLQLAGKWTADGERVCLRQSQPPLPGKLCQALPTQPGVLLKAEDPMGNSVQIKLVEGHVEKAP